MLSVAKALGIEIIGSTACFDWMTGSCAKQPVCYQSTLEPIWPEIGQNSPLPILRARGDDSVTRVVPDWCAVELHFANVQGIGAVPSVETSELPPMT